MERKSVPRTSRDKKKNEVDKGDGDGPLTRCGRQRQRPPLVPHRRVLYSRSRQSRLQLNLRIKNGERVSLRGAPKAPRIYPADRDGRSPRACAVVDVRVAATRRSYFIRGSLQGL